MVARLLAAQADVNKACNDGETPLHVACASGWVDVVTLLLAAGANVYSRDKHGWTPRQVANTQSMVQAVELPELLDAAMAKAKERCRCAVVALMMTHRGRADRHLVQLMGRIVWATREDVKWQGSWAE